MKLRQKKKESAKFFRNREREFLREFDQRLKEIERQGEQIRKVEGELERREAKLMVDAPHISTQKYLQRRDRLKKDRTALKNLKTKHARKMATFSKNFRMMLRPVTHVDLTRREQSELAGVIKRAKPKNTKYMNLTDPDCRRMRMGDRSFKNAYNLQHAIDDKSLHILDTGITRNAIDKHELRPIAERITAIFAWLKKIDGDAGYWVSHEIELLRKNGFDMAVPPNKPETKQRVDTEEARIMNRQLEKDEGKLRVRGRKKIEGKFGHKKFNQPFWRTYYRGVEKVQGFFNLEATAENLARTWVIEDQDKSKESTGPAKKSTGQFNDRKWRGQITRLQNLVNGDFQCQDLFGCT